MDVPGDVKESRWDASIHPQLTVAELVAQAKSTLAEIVVITVENHRCTPFDELTTALKSAGLRTHIETSGTHPLSGQWD